MAIATIASNDAGVGFYIETDGLKIYHAGDHAGWAEGEREGYEAEIDFLAEHASDIDMAFVNVTGCHAHDTLALQEGTYYTLEKLNPAHWFPTHGNNNEQVYVRFAEKVASRGFSSQAHCAGSRGDSFSILRNERINN
jgi:L-ascorbate metabolism protein UlaG (beta-lactamase superfamily)